MFTFQPLAVSVGQGEASLLSYPCGSAFQTWLWEVRDSCLNEQRAKSLLA